MSHPPITLPREATLDDALLLFDRHRIGALGVVDHDGVLVGIVTVRDVLGAFRRLFGIGAPGSSQIEIRDDGRPNLMSRIVVALEGAGTVCTRLSGRRAPAPRWSTPRADDNLHGCTRRSGLRARGGRARQGPGAMSLEPC
jgi:acetoin utilization protein AcuB